MGNLRARNLARYGLCYAIKERYGVFMLGIETFEDDRGGRVVKVQF